MPNPFDFTDPTNLTRMAQDDDDDAPGTPITWENIKKAWAEKKKKAADKKAAIAANAKDQERRKAEAKKAANSARLRDEEIKKYGAPKQVGNYSKGVKK